MRTLAACLLAVSAVPLAGTATRPLELRGTAFVVYSVAKGETVRFGLRSRVVRAYASTVPACEVLDHLSRRAVPQRSLAEADSVEYRAGGAGLNALVLHANRHWCRFEFAERPVMICARPESPLHFRGTPGPLYFLVPKASKSFDLFFQCPDKREGGTLRIADPDGQIAYEETEWFHKPKRVRLRVPPKARGRVWSLVTDDPRKAGKLYGIDDVVVYFGRGALPFVGRSREALLAVLLASGEAEEGDVAQTK